MANPYKNIKPTWDIYDITNNPEHDLFDDYIVEYNDISGIKIDYYIKKEDVGLDRLYGESTATEYSSAGRSRVIYDVTEEITNTGMFGIVSEDMIQYAYMPKSTFSRDISGSYDPKPGDVINIPWNNRQYEIVDVSEENKIFQLKKLIWEFVLKPFRFSDESESAKRILPDNIKTLTSPITAFGDNKWIEEESDSIDDFIDVDESIYGF